MSAVDLRRGDCLEVLRELPDASVHAIVTDPPYGLEFMGAGWDGQVPGVAYWRECLRVAKPGAHLVAFGGTRTFHRLAVAIEDAGFEIRDTIGLAAWVQGQGFPKGKSQLKPAWEPIIVARRPLAGTVAANVLAHGTGGINVDACRVEGVVPQTTQGRSAHTYGGGKGFAPEGLQPSQPHAAGRWPANVVLVHADTCEDGGACEDGCPVAELDRQSGNRPTGAVKPYRRANREGWAGPMPSESQHEQGASEGGASRFFPTFRYQAKAPARERPKIDGKGWPTVKPQGLMRWLVRLVTPPGGLVLDPFAGTGSTLQAARDEGFASIGIERDEFAYQLACQRLGLDDPEMAA